MADRGRHPADDALAAELAAGKTVRDAATAAGVGERTAFRRLTDPAFKARVSELRGAMVVAAAGRLADGMAAAADVLRELLTHDDPHVRHKAAVKILEVGVSLRSAVEFEGRLIALEAGRDDRSVA
jgi:HEAT repeat protein